VTLEAVAENAVFNGQFEKGRYLYKVAEEAAQKKNANEAAAIVFAREALWESLTGNLSQARDKISSAIKLNGGRDVTAEVALVSALLGAARNLTLPVEFVPFCAHAKILPQA
jgi:hypothetical protein